MNRDKFSQIDSLVRLLMDWADWQKGYRMKTNYPGRSAGFNPGGYVSKSFDEMAEENDCEICRLVDYAIDDLSPVHNAAIYRRYLSALFRFERVSYVEALEAAHNQLLVSLPKKGVVL